MKPADRVLRFLYFGILLAVAAAFVRMPSLSARPGIVLAILAVYSYLAAGLLDLVGREKALVFLETLPFFAFACVHLGHMSAMAAAPVVGASGLAGAAILAGEHLAVKTASFLSSLAGLAVFLLASLALETLPLSLFLGLSMLGLTITGYGLMRRRRG